MTSPLCDAKLAIMASSALDNPKWEAFAQAVALGSSAAEAYREHIARPNTSEIAIETNGPALARKNQVAIRILDLKGRVSEKADKKFDLSKDKWLEAMNRIATKAEECEDFSAAKGALAEVGKACDYYAPTKVEHSGGVAVAGLEDAVKRIFGNKP